MAGLFFAKGELIHPYDLEILEKTVVACNGRMKPGCKFACTMYGTDRKSIWSLPCVFKARYHTIDEGQRIRYRVWPGLLVWLLILLPLIVPMVMLVMGVEIDAIGWFGALAMVPAFAYTFQLQKAVAIFEKRFR